MIRSKADDILENPAGAVQRLGQLGGRNFSFASVKEKKGAIALEADGFEPAQRVPQVHLSVPKFHEDAREEPFVSSGAIAGLEDEGGGADEPTQLRHGRRPAGSEGSPKSGGSRRHLLEDKLRFEERTSVPREVLHG